LFSVGIIVYKVMLVKMSLTSNMLLTFSRQELQVSLLVLL